MSSPHEFGNREKSFDTILSMNVPAMLGRADAAYIRAVELLRASPFVAGSEGSSERTARYTSVYTLLNEARTNVENAVRAAKSDKRPIEYSAFLAEINFLCGMIHSLLCTSKVLGECDILAQKNIPSTKKSAASLYEIEEKYLEFELTSYHLALDTAEAGAKTAHSVSEHQKKLFSKADLERYKKAFEAFTDHYRMLD